MDGDLVGINLAVVLGAQNIGFAVPVDKVVQMMREQGKTAGQAK
jgi:S1-C subfamily serine protease